VSHSNKKKIKCFTRDNKFVKLFLLKKKKRNIHANNSEDLPSFEIQMCADIVAFCLHAKQDLLCALP